MEMKKWHKLAAMESWSLTCDVLDPGQKKLQKDEQLEVNAQEIGQKIQEGLVREERDSDEMSEVKKYPQ